MRSALSGAIHGALQATLGLPGDLRATGSWRWTKPIFVPPGGRGAGYTILEIVMFEGRTDETKRACLRRLMADVPAACGIPVDDLEIVGRIGDELQLSYKVET